ncbi:MAG: hypothetical protein H3C43_14115, partial [Leptonema sp. (in: Bacteria)]|nr:hypothetical protein [Leptonema sp. (in: bacteria)]
MATDNQEQPESQLSIQKDAPITVTGKVEKETPTGWQRWMWILIAIVSFVYIFIPEPTDAIPILGWLDEGLA